MSFSVTAAKLTGNPDASGWSQIHDFKPEEEEKLKLRGHLFAVIATKGGASDSEDLQPGGGVDFVAGGRELLSRLHEEYFGSIKESAFEALKTAVEKVIEEFSPSWGNVEISAISLLGDVVYSVAGGGAQVSILRDGMLAKILVSSGAPISASGYPKDDDILIAGTKEFFDSFPGGVIKAALDSRQPQSAIESLAPTVLTKQDKGRLGAIFLKFERKSLAEKAVFPSEPGRPIRGRRLVRKLVSPLVTLKDKFFAAISKRLPERKIFIKGGQEEVGFVSQRRRISASVGIILLALLVVSIFFGVRQKISLEKKARYEPKLTSAQHQLSEALDLFSLNPARARELFKESRREVDGMLLQGISDPALLELKKKLEGNTGKILGEYGQEPELYLDLSLLSSGFEGNAIASSEENLFILDSKGKKIIKIETGTKRSEVVAGPSQIEEAHRLTAYSDRVFVLNSEGIFEVGKENKKVVEADWGESPLLSAYAGNLYILEKAASVIWRYLGTGSGFSSKQNWLAPGIKKDLSGVSAWCIDGSIWLVTSSGEILKFTNGNPQGFVMTGVESNLAHPISAFSTGELEELYVLDPENSRVLVLSKKGEFVAQYISDKIKEAQALVVSEKEKRIIFLTGDKLYSIELEHF